MMIPTTTMRITILPMIILATLITFILPTLIILVILRRITKVKKAHHHPKLEKGILPFIMGYLNKTKNIKKNIDRVLQST